VTWKKDVLRPKNTIEEKKKEKEKKETRKKWNLSWI
jgi:hypothetical protein